MKSLCNWILNGKGRGTFCLMLFSLLFSFAASFIVYLSWNNLFNQFQEQNVLKPLPSIRLENGVLIEPADFYYNVSWSMVDALNGQLENYHFIIDTRKDEIASNDLHLNGFYLTRKNLYILKNGILTVQSFQSVPNFEIKQGELISILDTLNLRFSTAFFFVLFIFLFLILYLWSIFFSFFSYLLTFILSDEKYSFAVRRRLSSVSLIFSYIFILFFVLAGFYNGFLSFFFLNVFCMIILLGCLPKKIIISIDNN